ncbi:MAG TPA: arylsulfatase [Candidatus Brocadiia bacterium]|nr:arylsulfatase [Candidatus Brocadiia bacterium]
MGTYDDITRRNLLRSVVTGAAFSLTGCADGGGGVNSPSAPRGGSESMPKANIAGNKTAASASAPDAKPDVKRPNIIIIYADDLGFGDVGCYGATRIPTPNVDRLASQGLLFTNGYATAATCTPSRYSLLTGSYPFRCKGARILPGDAPLIIPPGSPTLPAILRRAGYATGVVGKWHLGIGRGNPDWNADLTDTPLDVGFDYSFIMAATNDRVPCVYVEGRRVAGLDPADPIEVTYDEKKAFTDMPTGRKNPELLRMKHSHGHDMTIVNGVGRIGYMRGGKSALWTDETMAEVFSDKAIEFVSRNREKHFFLYYALHQPHVPRLPGPAFAGKTGLGPRGDVIAEMDWCVGRMLDALDRLGLAENTIVIFSSDNGPVLDDGYQDRAVELCGDHRPAGALRGGKYSMFDGGTRVPLILRWPAAVSPGETDAMVCHMDFLASFAALTGVEPEPQAGPDSLNVLPALLGNSADGRNELVIEGTQGKMIIRQDNWVFIPPYAGPAVATHVNIELGNSLRPQLYDLSADVGQIRNVAGQNKERSDAMSRRLRETLESRETRRVD